MLDGKCSVNIATSASATGLKTDLQKEANRRGMSLSALVAQIYNYAVDHHAKFEEPLKTARPKPGDHISASVPIKIRDNLNDMAEEDHRTRSLLCCFILEKVLEDNLLPEVFQKKQKRKSQKRK